MKKQVFLCFAKSFLTNKFSIQERRLLKFNQMKTEIINLVETLELTSDNEFQDAILSSDNCFANMLTENYLSKVKSWLIEVKIFTEFKHISSKLNFLNLYLASTTESCQ